MEKNREGRPAPRSAEDVGDDAPISHARARGPSARERESTAGTPRPPRARTPKTGTQRADVRDTAGGERAQIVLITEDPLGQLRVVRALETAGHSIRIEHRRVLKSVVERDECDLVLVAEDAARVLELDESPGVTSSPQPPMILLTHAVDDAAVARARRSELFLLRSGDAELRARVRSAVALHRADRALAEVKRARVAEQTSFDRVTSTLALARASFHELRNVLVVVELGAHALLRERTSPQDSAEIIASIDDAAQRMRRLFTKLDEELGDDAEL